MAGLSNGQAALGSLIRALAVRAASIVIGLTVALVIVEGFLRFSGLAPTDGVATVTEEEFRSVPGLLAPNQDLTDRRIRTLPHHVSVNALGYRGPALASEKAQGEIRVLMAGDSFTYGDFVNDDETLPAQFERQLNQRCAGVRAINAGVGGTTIDTHARIIERALSLKPDLVVLTFSENDLDDLAEISAWDRFAANRAMKSRPPLSILYPVFRRLALWNFALEARARLRTRVTVSAAAADPPGEVAKKQRRAARLPLLELYAKTLTALRDRLATERVALILTLFPSHLTLENGASTEQLDWVMRAAREARVSTLNLLAPLKESGQSVNRLYLLPDDGHPSKYGYEAAAMALTDFVARGVLRTSCTAVLQHRSLEAKQ